MIPGALVVLFNPSDSHVDRLFRLKDLCEHVVAVDNSLVLDVSLQQRIQAAGIEMLSNCNRGGVAGAYNSGLRRLIDRQCQLLFIFDQDSEIPDNYFMHMRDRCLKLGTLFLIGPKIFDINVSRYLPAHLIQGYGVKALPITDEDHGIFRCSSIITSGSVLTAETHRTLGPFREDFFIDHVDTEYSFRAAAKGIPVYIDTSLKLKHEVGKRIDRKLSFLTIIQWNTSPLRQYYSARNCIHISRLYGARFPILVLVNVLTMQQLISVALYEEDKTKKIAAIVAGIMDGLRGRYGTFETCRPRSSAFCAQAGRRHHAS